MIGKRIGCHHCIQEMIGNDKDVEDKNARKKRREIFDYYQEALGDLPGIEFMPEPEWSRSNRWLTVILIKAEEFGAGRNTQR
jgi:dTDP-4-amino-4,6-dideoxygalactose transaminase